MSYSINSGLLTWWDLELRRSDTTTNPSSIVTSAGLISVSVSFVLCCFGNTRCCDQFAIRPTYMLSQTFIWPMTKSTCPIILNEGSIEPTFMLESMRTPSLQCEKPSVWASELLTSATFRLNSRDHVRSQSSTDRADNSYGLHSLRVAQGGNANKSYKKPTTVAINVHHSETTFPEIKHDHNVGSSSATSEMRISVWSLRFFVTIDLMFAIRWSRPVFPLTTKATYRDWAWQCSVFFLRFAYIPGHVTTKTSRQ